MKKLFVILCVVLMGCSTAPPPQQHNERPGIQDLNDVNVFIIDVGYSENISWNWTVIDDCERYQVTFTIIQYNNQFYTTYLQRKTCEGHNDSITGNTDYGYELTWEGVVTIKYDVQVS